MFRALSAAAICRRLTAPSALMLTAGLDAARRFARMPRDKHPSWNTFGGPTQMTEIPKTMLCRSPPPSGKTRAPGSSGQMGARVQPAAARPARWPRHHIRERTRIGSRRASVVSREVNAFRAFLKATIQGQVEALRALKDERIKHNTYSAFRLDLKRLQLICTPVQLGRLSNSCRSGWPPRKLLCD